MDPKGKFKSKRGTTLIEVLLVVAIIVILLGIAVPDLLSQAKQLKMVGLNDAARSVAVAVQSKLYGLKNAETASERSYYGWLNETVATEADIHLTSEQDSGESEIVKYVTNFQDGEKGELGKQFFFSGFLTDTELLEKGYIVMFYKPSTGDVLEVFYSDKPITLSKDEGKGNGLLDFLEMNVITQDYLDMHEIGHYFGYGVEEPLRLNGMPLFTCTWIWDDELRLQITMLTEPAEELLDVPLGLEFYLEFPALEGSDKSTEEMMIYAEGIFASPYKTAFVKDAEGTTCPKGTIQTDSPLTLREIRESGGVLNFALDGMVIDSVTDIKGQGTYENYTVKKFLYKQNYPDLVSVVEKGKKLPKENWLYPRESLNRWLDPTQNPFITVWYRKHATASGGPNPGDDTISSKLNEMFVNYASNKVEKTPTNFVKVDECITLRAELFALETSDGTVAGCTTDTVAENSALLRKRAEDGPSATLRSHRINPYFRILSDDDKSVSLASIRDLANLPYVFNGVENSVERANLVDDITGNQFYEKLINVRKKLCEEGYIGYGRYSGSNDTSGSGDPWSTTNDSRWSNKEKYPKYDEWGKSVPIWDIYRINESVSVSAMDLQKPFMIDGTVPESLGGGSYKIQNITFSGRQGGLSFADPAGLFEFARGCVFKNLDIVNPRIWRRRYDASCLKSEDGKTITGIEVSTAGGLYGAQGFYGGPGGGLVAFAVNCEFTNVRVYLQDDEDIHPLPNSNLSTCYIDNSILGGIVGVAVGDSSAATENPTAGRTISNTTFTNCAASIHLINAAYDPAARVVYAGGLVGIAMGDVTIQNSYAASVLSSYYAGGLVGATISDATWKFAGGTYRGIPFTGEGKVSQAPKIENSFSAGIIGRQVRVGAGLIASWQNTMPQVTGCYSASWWEAISPVAYGTFKGDKQNYYVYQTRFPVPVTSNVEAWFSATGDVLSLQSGDHGIACTGGDLAGKLEDAGWTTTTAPTLANTHQWSPGSGHVRYRACDSDHIGWPARQGIYNGQGIPEAFPFPMSEGNDEFWGDWIRNGTYVKEATGTGAAPTTFKTEFLDYFCTYYQSSDGGNLRNDITQIASRDDYATAPIWRYGSISAFTYDNCMELRRRLFQIEGDVVSLRTNYTVNDSKEKDWIIKSNGTGFDALEYWWAEGANPAGSLGAENWGNEEKQTRKYNLWGSRGVPGDVEGVTDVSGSNGNIIFTAPKFYDPDFNPIEGYKGYGFTPTGADIELGTTGVLWDFYGFFCCAGRTAAGGQKIFDRYYIVFTGGESLSGEQAIVSGNTVIVNEAAFKAEIPFEKVTLGSKDVQIEYDDEGGFHIAAVSREEVK